MADIQYDIVKEIGQISQDTRGWSRELNLVSWNGRPPKYDIRDWSAGHDRMGKGVTLTAEELIALRELLNKMEL